MKNTLLMLFIVSLLFGCKKEETLTINQDQVSLHYDGQFTYSLKLGGSNVAWKDITANVVDKAVGTINNSGVFSAKKIGTTTITFQYGGSTVRSTVTVEPYQTFFTEPVIVWNASMQDIRSAEKRNLQASDSEVLGYQGENSSIRGILYTFPANRMNGAIVLFAAQEGIVEKVATFYNERYDYVGTHEEVIFFTNGSIAVGISINENLGFIATYFDPTSSSARASLLRAKNNGLDTDIKQLRLK